MTWLITGGAGYIGAHVARSMAAAGERAVVLDDLSTGVPERVPAGIPLVRGSLLDRGAVDRTLREHAVTGVVHLAAKKQVGESVEQPLRYYRENLHGLTVLLEGVVAAGVRRFLFSSSAAVYGVPDVELITERTPAVPINPYGETKLAGEWLVRATGRAHGIATGCLRYFNVAGAAAPELADTGVFNIIPMFFDRISRGEAPRIFGDDYPTPDGTCIRDYIHVADLADAHLAAARWLAGRDDAAALTAGGNRTAGGDLAADGDLTVNIGRGEGVSVRELAAVVAEVTGHRVAPVVEARRPGDAARAVASVGLIAGKLGWTASRGVREMVESAWEGWRLHHPAASVG
ncbi:NAD-dependent epimerase/dehydratase family protein [Streptomyces sp. GMY02]|uniref:NAD-dependent epimerase/dehydratase family protein n=1 Tax=Streptomyces sp. GMY02 TaxID=1333528 RepID=UPI001C2B8D75|nr:NAD-dependent epimerase/dehydratase family protein [Streptomyces sp. GMY02]QXE33597.1 NAD-dependent epimerase/dehydratase family protein [Streptomyces sp. GMY02]